MFTFKVERYLPKFILADKNGYAIAKAIEAAMQYMNDTISSGVKMITDFDSMPEWRLDELAWETNCLYDYTADVETKREWIKNAIPLYRLYGTPRALEKFVGSYFNGIEVDENWIYGGEPFHFRVTVDGIWTPENEAWARKAIDTAKNVRSVLDSLAIGSRSYIALTAEGEVLARFYYPMTGGDFYTGTWPNDNIIAAIDETGKVGTEGNAADYRFPYTPAGTVPDTNMIGVVDTGGKATVLTDVSEHKFPYDTASEDVSAGTRPDINTLGVLDISGKAGIAGEAKGHSFPYELAGTIPQESTIGEISNNNIQSAQSEDLYVTVEYKMCGMDEI